MQEKNSYLTQKVVIFGDSYIGKTALLKCFIDLENRNSAFYNIEFACQKFEKHQQTIFKKDNQKINLQLFDTFGQQRYKFIREKLLNSNFIIMAYDISERASFNTISLEIMNSINRQYNAIIILIGNKSDLEHKREVSYQEGLEIANQNGFYFFETSALKGFGVDDLKNKILDIIVSTQ